MFKLKIIDKPEIFKMKCNFDFPDIPVENLQEKKVEPTTNIQEIKPDTGYVGLSKVTVDKVTNKIDDNIIPSNIKKDVSILGVTGNVVELQGEERTITPTKEVQVIEPNVGKNGITKATINAIPDEYIIPSGALEIKSNGNYNVKDKEFANVNVPEKVLGTKTITSNGTYKASDDNLDGYSQVEVETSGVDINDYYVMTNQYSSFNYYIKKIPKIKIGSYMNYLFSNMANLQETDSLDTSLVSSANGVFSGCQSLKKLPQLNFLKCVALSNIFNNCYNFETFGGLLNLGEAYSTTASENNNSYTLKLSSCTKLTHDSLMNVINGLYNIATKGVATQQLILGDKNIEKLTAEEIAIATEHGWSVS